MAPDPLIPLYLYTGAPPPRPERLYDYLLSARGIIKRIETAFVSADHLLAPLDVELTGLRLADYSLQPLRFKLPRIPGHLLREVLADARQNLDLEVMYQFVFETDRWLVSRPEQVQSRLRVGYRTAHPGRVVLEIHSHHVMPAFFSGVDDQDEQGGHFYGVIGRLDRPEPELALRLGLYGHHLPNVPPQLLFEAIEPFTERQTDSHQAPPAIESGSWLTHLFNWRR